MANDYMSMDILQDRIRAKKTPICLTLAPSADDIPQCITGLTAERLFAFSSAILEKAAATVPAVMFKPSAFEVFGWQGVEVMSRLMTKAKELGLYVIADCAKGEISDGTGWVCSAYLSGEAFDCDCVTVSGYPGSDGIKPYIDYCGGHDKTFFVVVKTANATSREFQELVAGDRLVYNVVGDLCQRLARKTAGKWGFTTAGMIFGPAYTHNMDEIRKRYPETFFLIPEYGGQGGRIFDCAAAFNKYGHGAIIASQSAICGSWRTLGRPGEEFADAAEEILLSMKADARSMIQVL